MKPVLVPILMLLLITQVFNTWFIQLVFTLNRDNIAANLCENRTRPAMNCNGQCVLMKKMREEENKKQEQPRQDQLNFSLLVLSSKTFFAGVEISTTPISVKWPPDSDNGMPIDRSPDIFHPPALS